MLAAGAAAVPMAGAQQAAATAMSIATVPVAGVLVSGSLSVADGRAVIGNNGSITAGEKTARVRLTRGGELNVCATTRIHLSTDNTKPGGAVMIALDRGAIEAHYKTGEYADEVLTPDLRILISPPGEADLSLRVNNQGDTCVDNHGEHAPYVLASSLFDGGAYRIQPNQRVLFEHGSVRDVVDNEREPCGCPAPPVSVAQAGVKGAKAARPGEKVAKNKAEAENPFPLAESEGLAPPPKAAAEPAVPAGEAHAEVEAPLVYNAAMPPPAAMGQGAAVRAQAAPKRHAGFFGHVGHFFRRLFGG